MDRRSRQNHRRRQARASSVGFIPLAPDWRYEPSSNHNLAAVIILICAALFSFYEYTEHPLTHGSLNNFGSIVDAASNNRTNFISLGATIIFSFMVPFYIVKEIYGGLSKRILATMNPGSAYPKGFSNELMNRFPKRDIFFINENVRKVVSSYMNADIPAFHEDLKDSWDRIIQIYPNPPRNDQEAKSREQQFWQTYAQYFITTNSNGEPSLRPEQEIKNYFNYWEKWIFREYYAATGVIKKSYVEEFVRLTMEIERAKLMTADLDPYSPASSRRHQAIEKATDTQKNFLEYKLPDHYEKWGGWFYSGIERAFNTMHRTKQPFGPAEVDTNPIDALDYKRNS